MPMPTIPGIPPETWEQLLEILASLNTDIVELGEQGITTFEQLKQWLTMQGYELVEISEVVGYTIAKTSAVDPTTTNAVANRVATDIVATGGAGTAVTQFVTGGNRTLALVPKVVAAGACLSMLVSLIGAGLVSDENKEDLVTSVDPYTIDGENVPVLIDENGKTHFLEEMVEAIRAKAIELGIFDTESGYDIDTTGHTYNPSMNIINLPIKTAGVGDYFSISHYGRVDIYTLEQLTNCAGVMVIYSDGRIAWYIYATGENPSASIRIDETKDGTITYTYHRTPTFSKNAFITVDGLRVDLYSGHQIISVRADPVENTFPANTVNATDSSTQINYILFYGDYTAGGGVEGITPAQDLITAGVADVTKPLTEVLPQLATGQMSIASPTEDDLTHKSNWYPVSINSTDVFTDGATEEETSAATDGKVKPDVQPSILDAIEELIKNLYPDGTPEIPVSDSGDTPPAEPPLISGSANGLWSIYNPTLQQVQDFGSYLWSESILDQITRMFNSPIDAVIGFHMIYCTPIKGPAKNIKCGYLDTGVSSITVANQYATIDCGTIEVPEFYRTALDYVSTKLALYLPFIGIVPLSTAVCMGSTLQVIYRIDVLTGTCLAQVKVIKENSDAVMYAFEGNCSVQIPLTATTYTGIASALINTVSAGLSVFMGDYISAAGDVGSALGAGMTNLSGTKQSGQMGANAGALGIRIPYLIITHPVSYDAVQYNTQYGYPLNQTTSLGSVTGYTRVKDIHLAGIPCTDDELEMIERLLKDGVIIN